MVMIAGNSAIIVPESLITVVTAVAVYFLILGLLNSRKTPQLLTGPEDSLLLIGSVCLVAVPLLLGWLGTVGLLAAVGLTAAGVIGYLVLSRPRVWVVYNLPAALADGLVEDVLSSMGRSFSRSGRQFVLSDGTQIEVSCFALLRSVSIRMHGGAEGVRRQFGELLIQATTKLSAETSPSAMALLLVATAMLIAPLMLAAHRAGEIVRLLSDLLQ